MTYIIHGETPSKKNSRIINRRTGRSFPSKKYTEWHDKAMQEVWISGETIYSSCSISLHFFHGDLRRRDSDNGTSSILDLLVDARVLSDDNWQVVSEIKITNSYDKGNPRCEVTIERREE